MRTLAPLRLKPSYWKDTEDQIIAILKDGLFRPIVTLIKQAKQDAAAARILSARNAIALSNASREDKLLEAQKKAGKYPLVYVTHRDIGEPLK